jgi:hypothetical protein
MKNHGELTPEEIRELDAMTYDSNAVTAAMEIAIQYSINKLSQLDKQRDDLWTRLGERLGFEYPGKVPYVVRREEGHISVVELDPDEYRQYKVG